MNLGIVNLSRQMTQYSMQQKNKKTIQEKSSMKYQIKAIGSSEEFSFHLVHFNGVLKKTMF